MAIKCTLYRRKDNDPKKFTFIKVGEFPTLAAGRRRMNGMQSLKEDGAKIRLALFDQWDNPVAFAN